MTNLNSLNDEDAEQMEALRLWATLYPQEMRRTRRKETLVWAMTGLVFLLIFAAWLTWAWAVGPVG
jgi:uncharacterized membrane protein YdbT with pleckstrin-like domain